MLPPIADLRRVPRPLRKPLQFVVIAVMSVMRGAFPDTYGVLYMTMNRSVFGDRHVYRHCGNLIYKRVSDYHDDDDANDDGLQAFSWGSLIRQGLQPTRLFAIRRSGSPASLTRASLLINLPQPSAQSDAA